MGLSTLLGWFRSKPAPQTEVAVVQRLPAEPSSAEQPAPARAPHQLQITDLESLTGTIAATLEAVPRLAQQSAQAVEALADAAARSRQRDQAIERGLVRLSESSTQQTQVLGLVQQQLDLNHEVSMRVAESLRETSTALTAFAATSERQAKAIEALATSTQQRVRQADRLERALQFWMGALGVVCVLALIYALWAATRGPVIIAVPQPAPVAPPAASPPPTTP
jgi:hypothetical protein